MQREIYFRTLLLYVRAYLLVSVISELFLILGKILFRTTKLYRVRKKYWNEKQNANEYNIFQSSIERYKNFNVPPSNFRILNEYNKKPHFNFYIENVFFIFSDRCVFLKIFHRTNVYISKICRKNSVIYRVLNEMSQTVKQ